MNNGLKLLMNLVHPCSLPQFLPTQDEPGELAGLPVKVKILSSYCRKMRKVTFTAEGTEGIGGAGLRSETLWELASPPKITSI